MNVFMDGLLQKTKEIQALFENAEANYESCSFSKIEKRVEPLNTEIESLKFQWKQKINFECNKMYTEKLKAEIEKKLPEEINQRRTQEINQNLPKAVQQKRTEMFEQKLTEKFERSFPTVLEQKLELKLAEMLKLIDKVKPPKTTKNQNKRATESHQQRQEKQEVELIKKLQTEHMERWKE